MKQRSRIYYTESQKSLMWDRWQQGESLHSIARLFGRGHSSIQRILSETGGIRPNQRARLGEHWYDSHVVRWTGRQDMLHVGPRLGSNVYLNRTLRPNLLFTSQDT